jgi:hypothetical protein
VKILIDHEGRAIRLTGERLAHILEHPEMQGMEGRIEETVKRPEKVLESLSDPKRGFTTGSTWVRKSATSIYASRSRWRTMTPSY